MAISTSNNSITALGNGVQTVFSFNFIAGAATNINVNLINTASGTSTLLSPSAYTVSINAPATGQLWGVGGTITYPISGSPIATGFQLQISRILPLTQVTSLANQGDFLPNVIEQALDTLEMQIQQLSARTTQFRGTWATGLSYSIGDIVQDGAAGLNTLNYYICINANVSGAWATDLANGDWAVSVYASVPAQTTNLTGAVVGTSIGGTIATTLAANAVGTTNIVANAVTAAKIANNTITATQIANATVTGTQIASATVTLAEIQNAVASSKLVGSGTSGSGSSYSELTLGANLSMSGTTLNATAGVFTKSFTSTAQTITFGAQLAPIPHGFGSIPKFVVPFLTNTIANAGYSPGDVMQLNPGFGANSVQNNSGIAILIDATNIYVTYGQGIAVLNKTTGAAVQITAADWTFSFSAYA